MAGSTQDDEEIFAAIDKTLENMIEGGSYLFNYYPDDVMVKASSGIISEESGMFTMGLGTWGITQFTLYPMWARGFLTHGRRHRQLYSVTWDSGTWGITPLTLYPMW